MRQPNMPALANCRFLIILSAVLSLVTVTGKGEVLAQLSEQYKQGKARETRIKQEKQQLCDYIFKNTQYNGKSLSQFFYFVSASGDLYILGKSTGYLKPLMTKSDLKVAYDELMTDFVSADYSEVNCWRAGQLGRSLLASEQDEQPCTRNHLSIPLAMCRNVEYKIEDGVIVKYESGGTAGAQVLRTVVSSKKRDSFAGSWDNIMEQRKKLVPILEQNCHRPEFQASSRRMERLCRQYK